MEQDPVQLSIARYRGRHPEHAGESVARVIAEHRSAYVIHDGQDLEAVVRGTFHLDADFPKVGDFVAWSPAGDGTAVIEAVLPRETVLARKASGEDAAQVIAANVDLLLAVQGLDQDFSPRRLERYALLARQGGAEIAIVLTKKDLARDLDAQIAEAQAAVPGARIVVANVPAGDGVAEADALLPPGVTAVLAGSSGAGKSTLLNALVGYEKQRTQEVRAEDGKGRHTTVHRELFALPGGALVIDTPGMRELGVLAGEEQEREDLFADVAELAARCRFRDCDHERSAGCAIREAVDAGGLDEARVRGWMKLKREQAFAASRMSAAETAQRTEEQRKLQQGYRGVQQRKYGDQDTLAS